MARQLGPSLKTRVTCDVAVVRNGDGEGDIRGRVTLRPFRDRLAGRQLSLRAGDGKGNTPVEPEYSYLAGMLS